MKNAQSIDSLKVAIFQVLTKTRNLELLEQINSLLSREAEQERVVGFRPNGEPMTRGQLEKEVLESRAEFEEGEFMTVEELEEDSKTWI